MNRPTQPAQPAPEPRAEAKAASQRPELPDFWDQRFAAGVTPWNAQGMPAAMRDFAAQRRDAPRTLIPGCGHAWEAAALAAHGWPVTALDFSSAAVAAARKLLGDWPGQLLQADFFDFVPDAPYDLIYERAFLCALPRQRWPDYAPRLQQLLRPGGLLAGFFYFDSTLKGPPFAITPTQLDALLQPGFECIDDQAVADSIPVFAGKERWQVWRRRDD